MSFENLSNPRDGVCGTAELFSEVLLVVLSGADKQNVTSLHNCLNAPFLRVSFVEACLISNLFIAPLRTTGGFRTSPQATYTVPGIAQMSKDTTTSPEDVYQEIWYISANSQKVQKRGRQSVGADVTTSIWLMYGVIYSASSMALPMSWRIYLFAKEIHSVAL